MSDTYSTKGPICPYCSHEHLADEPFFFDEGLESMECDKCQKEFRVEAYMRWSWSCEPLAG